MLLKFTKVFHSDRLWLVHYLGRFGWVSSSDPHPETLLRHSFWHTICKCIYIYGIFILAFYLTFFLAYLWHSIRHSIWHLFWQTFWHIFWHSFWHSIWHLFRHSISHLFRNSCWYCFWHRIWHIFWHSFSHSIWYIFGDSLWLKSGGEHSDPEIAVEVRRETLWSGACGGGPPEVAVGVRRGTLRSRACSWGPAEEGGRKEEGGSGIKSNNPHLTGGEQRTWDRTHLLNLGKTQTYTTMTQT